MKSVLVESIRTLAMFVGKDATVNRHQVNSVLFRTCTIETVTLSLIVSVDDSFTCTEYRAKS